MTAALNPWNSHQKPASPCLRKPAHSRFTTAILVYRFPCLITSDRTRPNSNALPCKNSLNCRLKSSVQKTAISLTKRCLSPHDSSPTDLCCPHRFASLPSPSHPVRNKN